MGGAAAAVLILCLGSVATVQAENFPGYADSSGEVVKNDFGDCWHTSSYTEADALVGCDREPEVVKAAPVPVFVPTTFSDVVYFDFDDSALSSSEQRSVDDVASRVASLSKVEEIQVVGHTDSVGNPDYNQILSEERAQTVVDRLVALGVPRQNISLRGMGEFEPASTNDTDEGRAQNRRAEIMVQYMREEMPQE
jgi:OOP family OmpA-OmpF porin